MRENGIFILIGFMFLVLIVVRIGAEIQVRNGCDGAVVKNTFEWPVCVEGGK